MYIGTAVRKPILHVYTGHMHTPGASIDASTRYEVRGTRYHLFSRVVSWLTKHIPGTRYQVLGTRYQTPLKTGFRSIGNR